MARQKSSKTVKGPSFKELEGFKREVWKSGRKVSQVSYLQRKDGTKGISFKMGTVPSYMDRPRFGSTIWIDKELDLPSWLRWFIKTLAKSYLKLFGKKIPEIDEQKEYYKSQVEELAKKLAEAQQKLEEAEKRDEAYKETIEFAKEVTSNLYNYKSIYEDFKKIVQRSKEKNKGKEEEIKRKIKAHQWLLGLECFVEAKNQRVDNQTEIDLHIKTKYGQDRIFEIKSPNIKPLVRKTISGTRRLIISPDLADGLSELILYLRRTDIHSEQKNKGTYGIHKASGYILVGFNLNSEEEEILKELNFHLYPHIQITTYNNLLGNIKQELKIIEILDKNKSRTHKKE
jgi:hypothetical protein